MTARGGVAAVVIAVVAAVVGGCSSTGTGENPEVCLTGTLGVRIVDAEEGRAERTALARRVDWEMVRHANGESATVASGTTDVASGGFRACARGIGPFQVRFTSSSGPTATEVHATETGGLFEHASPESATSTDFGVLVVGDPRKSYAFKIVDDVGRLFDERRAAPGGCWFAAPKLCGKLLVDWSTDPNDDVSEFDIEGDRIAIGHRDARSRHLVVHEAAHWLHYGEATATGWPTVVGCDDHTADKASSPTCAWTEGFADAAAAYVLGDDRYVFPDGGSVAFGPDADTTQWDSGGDVQGRVAGALLQIWKDVDGGDWRSTLGVLGRNVHTIGDYYRERVRVDPAEGTAIRAILAAHTIPV